MPRALKKPKDPNAPKRPLSSYFIFSNERRAVMAKEMPDKKLTELSKLISAEWKELGADIKESYTRRWTLAKQEYDVRLDEYKQTDQYHAFERKLSAWKSEEAERKQQEKSGQVSRPVSLPRKPKDPNCPKRSKTSYFLYGDSVREQTKAENPDAKITEIARIIGAKWKELSEDEKRPFSEQAATLKKAYNAEMELYKDSDDERRFKRQLDEWKAECERRKQAARDRQEANRVEAQTKGKRGKSKGRASMVEDSSEEDSSSEGSSGSSDESSGSSGSEGSSDSQSSSDDS